LTNHLQSWHLLDYRGTKKISASDATFTNTETFGAVLYEMATGQLPFRGESRGVIFDGIMNRAPLPPLRLNPDLPPKLEDIVNKALEKDRDLRYQHAADMRTDLQRLKRGTDFQSPGPDGERTTSNAGLYGNSSKTKSESVDPQPASTASAHPKCVIRRVVA